METMLEKRENSRRLHQHLPDVFLLSAAMWGLVPVCSLGPSSGQAGRTGEGNWAFLGPRPVRHPQLPSIPL